VRTWRPTRRLVIGGLTVVVVNVALVVSLSHFHHFGRHILAAGLLFAAVACWVRKDAGTVPVWTIVALTIVAQLPGVFMHPLTSDDAYRYVWDGRVQLAGIDPYRYVPLDPAVHQLRDAILFPNGRIPRINRPYVPTIYPPVGQLWFTVVALLVPWSWGTVGVQAAAASAVVVTTWLLARYLGQGRGAALLYGSCPAVMIEAANGAHLDALTALLVFGVGWAAVRRRPWLAGLFLGLAAGMKLVPLLLTPVFLLRGRWRTTLTSVLLTLTTYVPHVLVVGALVLGFLPGYLQEEGYGGDRRFALLLWLPESARTLTAAVIAMILAAVAFRRSRTEPVLAVCAWLYGCSFLLATPIYSWYALPLVVLAIMARRLEWLSVWSASYVAFVFDHQEYVQAASYGVALVVVVCSGWSRRTHLDPPSTHRSAIYSGSHDVALADRVGHGGCAGGDATGG
jgi:hypothetical protein